MERADWQAKIVDPKSFEDVPIIDLSGDEAVRMVQGCNGQWTSTDVLRCSMSLQLSF